MSKNKIGLFIINLFRRDCWRKLVALFLALLLYVAIAPRIGEKREKAFYNVPVHIELPPHLALSNPELHKVKLVLSGHASALDDIDPGALNIRAVVHAEGVVPGQPYPLRLRLKDVSGLPRGVRVLSISPRDLPLDLEPIGRKKVPVRAKYDHQLHEDYKIAGERFQYPEVTITGKTKDLESINEIYTNPIPLDRYIRDDFSNDCTLNIPSGIRVDISKMKVTVKVEKAYNDAELTVRVNIVQSAEHTRKFKVVKQDPEYVTVKVKGTYSALDELKNSDVVASVNLETVDKSGTYTLPIGITINNNQNITIENQMSLQAQITVQQE